jgi:hypothetical protein
MGHALAVEDVRHVAVRALGDLRADAADDAGLLGHHDQLARMHEVARVVPLAAVPERVVTPVATLLELPSQHRCHPF